VSFPSIGEYAPLLESQGLEVDFAVLFDRATILEGASVAEIMARDVGRFAVEAIAPEQRKEFFSWRTSLPRPRCFTMGVDIDYKRLRLVAVKL